LYLSFLPQASEEAKFIKSLKTDRMKQITELRARGDDNVLTDFGQKKAFEDELQNCLSRILSSDDSRRASYQLARDEERQIVAVSTFLMQFNCFN